jgi:serine/threonine protein kinase
MAGAGSGEEFGPCPYCGQLHSERVLLCPTAEKLLPLEGRLLDGKFRFVRLLGEGGMGAVWKAQNVLVKKDVALKLMHAQFSSDEGVLARFRNEATAAGRIGSDHICDILDLGKSELGPYIVMELMNGKDFATLLQHNGRIDPGLAVLVVRQALKGLAAAHAVGIVHRDLKPENIFLHEPKPGRLLVKLMDFGISKFTEGETAGRTGVGVLMGTPEYMSPEQTEGAAQVDARTDIWAMGVILYWALAGRNPFVGPTMAATLVNVSTKTQPPLLQVAPHIDPHLVAIVDRCLLKDPEQRWPSAEALMEALRPYENRANGLYTPMDDEAGGHAPPRPGATIASSGPPPMRPGAAPTLMSAGPNPPTLGGTNTGVAAAPTWSGEMPGRPATSAPTLGGGDAFALSDAALNARPESSMSGGGKGLVILGIVLALGVLGGGGWFAVSRMGGDSGGKVASADDGKASAPEGDDGKGDDAAEDAKDDDAAVAGEAGDAKADEGGDAKADEGGDAKADEGGDVKADEGGDVKADEGGDVKADEGGDVKADEGGDVKADDGGPAAEGGDAGADGGAEGGAAEEGGDVKADDGGNADDDGGKSDDGGGTTKPPPPKKGPDTKLVKKSGSVWALKSPPGTAVTHGTARNKCAELAKRDYAGLKNWRLPTKGEMDRLATAPIYWLSDGSLYRKGGGKALSPKARFTCVAAK